MHVYLLVPGCLPLALETTMLLLITLLSLLELSMANRTVNTRHPPYDVRPAGNSVLHTHHPGVHSREISLQTLDATKSITLGEAGVTGEYVHIDWVNSSVHEISISWKLIPQYNMTGYIKHSVVEYFPVGGRFTSHPLPRDVRNYTFVNLDPGSLYTICVYMTEVYGMDNTTVSHSKCVKINTIEYIRRDSVVFVLVSLGYYAFMALIGYTQWKRRLCSIATRAKNRSRAKDEKEVDGKNANVAMRWKDLAERETLMNNSKPGCSIECNDT